MCISLYNKQLLFEQENVNISKKCVIIYEKFRRIHKVAEMAKSGGIVNESM